MTWKCKADIPKEDGAWVSVEGLPLLSTWFHLPGFVLVAPVYPAAQCVLGLKKGVLEIVEGLLGRRVIYAFALF